MPGCMWSTWGALATRAVGARSWLTVSLVSGGLGRLWFESVGSFGDALKLGLTL